MNELQSRLEYLVSYSSQLIFIGCDNAAQQQNALQQFLSSQHENVDVAYLTANSDLADSQCRAQIYQQLLHQTGFSESPLNSHLIKSLPQQSGPILICICAAHNLSDSMLTELWDLVIQNKEQTQGRHLNVLLFGDSQWIHQAKVKLSEKNAHIPILLSTETVSSSSKPFSLDDSIVHNRERIQKQMLAQSTSVAGESEQSDSVIQQAWFKLLSLVLFLGLFAMILFWQYPQEISRFLQPTYVAPLQGDQVTEPSPDKLNVSESVAAQNSPSNVVPAPEANTDAADGLNNNLHSDSDEQVATVPPRTAELANPDNPSEKSTVQTQVDEQPVVTAQTPEEPVSPPIITPQSNTDLQSSALQSGRLVTDWQIEVEKIRTAETPQPTQQPSAIEPAEPPESNPILTLAAESFVLQLAAMSDIEIRNDFIQEHGLKESSWTYTTQRFGGDWHVIVFARAFDSAASARSYIPSLPNTIDRNQPFAKSSQQVKQELSVSSPVQ